MNIEHDKQIKYANSIKNYFIKYFFKLQMIEILISILLNILSILLFWTIIYGDYRLGSIEMNTIVGVLVSYLFGYVLSIRFNKMPTVEAGASIISAFLVSYSFVIIIFFLFRLEYSRFSFVISYITSIVWTYLVSVFYGINFKYQFTVIPFGSIDNLVDINGVQWDLAGNPDVLPRNSRGVVADLRSDLPPVWQKWLTDCVLSGIPVYHIKSFREMYTGKLEIEHLSENTLGSLNPDGAYIAFKRLADSLFALVMLVVLLPAFIIVILIIRFDSPGSVMFLQKRIGFRGKEFTIYKFRTMVDRDADHSDSHEAKTVDNDPRVTAVGRFLRKWRIDELPQIINILRGEMSWIGPRPEAVPLSHIYKVKLPFYSYRHIVRPGISGWAQVNQGHVTDESEVLDKLHYDFYYIRNLSIWIDLIIVMKTIRTVFTGFGAR